MHCGAGGQRAGPGHRLHQPAELGLHDHQAAVVRVSSATRRSSSRRTGGRTSPGRPPSPGQPREQLLHGSECRALPPRRRVSTRTANSLRDGRPREPGVRLRACGVAEQGQERHQHRGRVGAGSLCQGHGNLAGRPYSASAGSSGRRNAASGGTAARSSVVVLTSGLLGLVGEPRPRAGMRRGGRNGG